MVERDKFANGPLPATAPRTLIVCPECANGWDEILGYVTDQPDQPGHSGHPPIWPHYVDDDRMPAESQIYPLDR